MKFAGIIPSKHKLTCFKMYSCIVLEEEPAVTFVRAFPGLISEIETFVSGAILSFVGFLVWCGINGEKPEDCTMI